MKRTVVGSLLMAAVFVGTVNFALAGEKVKTGVLTKTVFTDTASGFTTTLPSGWKAKTKAEPSRVRLVLETSKSQWAPLAPRTYVSGPFKPMMRSRETVEVRPKVLVLAERTGLSTEEFLGHFFGDTNWQERTTEYVMGLYLEGGTLEDEFNQQPVLVGGEPALQVTVLKPVKGSLLEQNVSRFSALTTVQRVVVTAFKHGSQVFVITLFSATGLVRGNYREIRPVLSDWKFLEGEKPDSTHPSN